MLLIKPEKTTLAVLQVDATNDQSEYSTYKVTNIEEGWQLFKKVVTASAGAAYGIKWLYVTTDGFK